MESVVNPFKPGTDLNKESGMVVKTFLFEEGQFVEAEQAPNNIDENDHENTQESTLLIEEEVTESKPPLENGQSAECFTVEVVENVEGEVPTNDTEADGPLEKEKEVMKPKKKKRVIKSCCAVN